MLRILLAALAVVLCGLVGACATTGSGGYSPTNSHFWCGEHCSVVAGCEEGLLCDCVLFNNGQELKTREAAEVELWEKAVSKLRESGFPNLTVDELRRKPHAVRIVHGSNNYKFVCGVFPKYAQFGTKVSLSSLSSSMADDDPKCATGTHWDFFVDQCISICKNGEWDAAQSKCKCPAGTEWIRIFGECRSLIRR